MNNGCFKYSFVDTFTGKPFDKTEFPLSWDCKKIIEHSFEVYENQASILSDARGNKISKALLIDDIKIEIIIKQHDQCANIITAYPVI